MTSYHGGKQLIGKKLAEVISDSSKNLDIKGYCEPFCGMLGVYQHIPELFQKQELDYKAGDQNESVIMMWQNAQQGWIPPTSCSEEEYITLKNIDHPSAKKGYIGHQFSFRGQYFKNYAPKYGKNPDQTAASNRVVNISNKLSKVKFSVGDYTQFSNLKNYVIYCDPPYQDTQCVYNQKFDNTKFWDWCRTMAKDNIVFVSEYHAPIDFTEIWAHKSEKLYILSKYYYLKNYTLK
jgi:DNA adenine methylase